MKRSFVIFIALMILSGIIPVNATSPTLPPYTCEGNCAFMSGQCEHSYGASGANPNPQEKEKCLEDAKKCSYTCEQKRKNKDIEEVKLYASKPVKLSNGLTLTAQSIEDSRCPPNADCIWQGEAVVTLLASSNLCKSNEVKIILKRPGDERISFSPDGTHSKKMYYLGLRDVQVIEQGHVAVVYVEAFDGQNAWCDVPPCPPTIVCLEQPKACTKDAKVCPDGSGIGRDPYNNCEWQPCPSENQCGTCKREYDECMTQEMVGIEKICEPKYKECLNRCQKLPVEPKCDNGCFSTTTSNDRCVSIGFRLKENDASMYCDINGMLKEQKSDGSQASNSYECLSNFQSDGTCVSVSENLNILQRIVKWFSKIFGGN